MTLYKNEFFELTVIEDKVYIKTFKGGYSLKDFDTILKQYPRIKLTNFAILKTVLIEETTEPKEFGVFLPLLELLVAKDHMSASITINEAASYIKEHTKELEQQINQLLTQSNINHGIQPINFEMIVPNKAHIVAQGTPPKKGVDATVTYIELPERKPVIREDGKADYYEMNFIFKIEKDMWLGEKIPATLGIPGMTIEGEVVPPIPGKNIELKYDHQSAYEVQEGDKIVLRALKDGVVDYEKGMLAVNQHLPINGDIGLETGNINFDGSVSVSGTVLSGFSLIAKGDISIEAPEAVQGAKIIKSVDGDIYIRGGIFGLNETIVEAGGSIFVKHVNDAHLHAKQNIHIGFYSIGSTLNATNIMLDEVKGKIVGGTAIAKQKIVTAFSSNRLERKTKLIIDSVNKNDVMVIVQNRAATLKKLQEENIKLETFVMKLMSLEGKLTEEQQQTFQKANQALKQNEEMMTSVDLEIKELMSELRNTGEEVINVKKEAFPGTYIQIGKKSTILTHQTNGSFKIVNGELNV